MSAYIGIYFSARQKNPAASCFSRGLHFESSWEEKSGKRCIWCRWRIFYVIKNIMSVGEAVNKKLKINNKVNKDVSSPWS